MKANLLRLSIITFAFLASVFVLVDLASQRATQAASSVCNVIVGTTGSAKDCKSIKINSQGLIYGAVDSANCQ